MSCSLPTGALQGCSDVAKAIGGSSSLQQLCASHTGWDDLAVQHLCAALTTCTTLNAVDLSYGRWGTDFPLQLLELWVPYLYHAMLHPRLSLSMLGTCAYYFHDSRQVCPCNLASGYSSMLQCLPNGPSHQA